MAASLCAGRHAEYRACIRPRAGRAGAGAPRAPRAPRRRMGALERGRRTRLLLEQPEGDTDASRTGEPKVAPPQMSFTVVTYNIHKGLSQFNRRLVLHDIRERLKALDADVAFLQEVQGLHATYARVHRAWPETGQHEFLTHEGSHSVYGMNAVYQEGQIGR